MSLSVNDYIKYDIYQLFLLNKNNFTMSLLRKAYQRQVLIYHPDKFSSDLSEEEKKERMDTFLLINNSYTILSNETMRKEYDHKRETYLSEEKGFGNLKSQFLKDTQKLKLSPEEFELQKTNAAILFNKNMEAMNSDVEKLSVSKQESEINEEVNSNVTLESESVKPSGSFDDDLSNVIANRNIKLENNGTSNTNLLTSGKITNKYAFIDEAFK